MADLSNWQLVAFFAIFVWSGFVRSALGFGGAALSLPLFLFIIDEPIEILPIIGIHLLLAVLKDSRQYYHAADWVFLRKTLLLMLPFKIAGVIGLLSLPATVLNVSIYFITSLYALSYITQIKVELNSKALDWAMLASGAYVSGTSLIGAPLIIAVYSKYLSPNKLRATLFMLWFVLVTIKLLGFVMYGTPLHLDWALYTLPFALIGQVIGDKAHQKILSMEKTVFMRWIGFGLLTICALGLARVIYKVV